MNRFPKEYKLTQEEIDNLNSPKPPKATEFVLKTFFIKKASWPRCFINKFHQILRGRNITKSSADLGKEEVEREAQVTG